MLLHPGATQGAFKIPYAQPHTISTGLSGNDPSISVSKILPRGLNVPPSMKSSGFTGSLSNLPKRSSCSGGVTEQRPRLKQALTAEGNAGRTRLNYSDGWLARL